MTDRFAEVQERAAKSGMVVGLYLHQLAALPAKDGEIKRLPFTRTGEFDDPLDTQLDTIAAELDYWESREQSA